MGKKKDRHLNIAKKRAKRQQQQKSKRKSLNVRKQQRTQSASSGEERLREKILKSRFLLEEPEFAELTFDRYMLLGKLTELLPTDVKRSPDEGSAVDLSSPASNKVTASSSNTAHERFRCEVLPTLLTLDFVKTVAQSLKACETRLTRIGAREKAEAARIARPLFEMAEPSMLTYHPLVVEVCVRTLEQLIDEANECQPLVQDVLAELQEYQQPLASSHQPPATSHQPETLWPEAGSRKPEAATTETTPLSTEPENLPAKALYKNFDGLEMSDTIEVGDGYRVMKRTADAVEFVHTTHKRYIRLTPERLLLHCAAKPDLEVAMSEIEKLCGESLFYLARTVEAIQSQPGVVGVAHDNTDGN